MHLQEANYPLALISRDVTGQITNELEALYSHSAFADHVVPAVTISWPTIEWPDVQPAHLEANVQDHRLPSFVVRDESDCCVQPALVVSIETWSECAHDFLLFSLGGLPEIRGMKETNRMTTRNASALQNTETTHRILDEIILNTKLSGQDKDFLATALQHTADEITKVVRELKSNGRIKMELAGLPASLAMLASLVIVTNDPAVLKRYREFLDSVQVTPERR